MYRLIPLLFLTAGPAFAIAVPPTQLPEPSVLGLIAAGVAGVGIAKWVHRKKNR